jgi:cell division transport system permease protein
MRSLPFLFREAFVNLRRHGLMTIASLTTIGVALALIGSFVLTFYQIHVATDRAVGDFEMHVFCLQTVAKTQIPEIEARIAALPGVRTVRYISKEKAFAESTKSLPIDTAGLPNQFNETFVLKMNDPHQATAIASQIRGWHDIVQEVSLPESEMGGMLRIANFLQTIGMIGGVILLIGALVVVSNTIRISLFSRRREIKIMQIVGATGGFIRLPLLLEGLIQGTLGGIVAAACLFFTAHRVNELTIQITPMMAHYFESVDMYRFGAAVVALGALVGAFGSLLSMRRYLKAV